MSLKFEDLLSYKDLQVGHVYMIMSAHQTIFPIYDSMDKKEWKRLGDLHYQEEFLLLGRKDTSFIEIGKEVWATSLHVLGCQREFMGWTCWFDLGHIRMFEEVVLEEKESSC